MLRKKSIIFKKEKSNVGFTLAEVLITLGIIGTVAALTIPTMISKTNNLASETAFKKQISVIQNQLDYMSFNENLNSCYITVITDPNNKGNLIYSSDNQDCSKIENGLVQNMKLTPVTNYSRIYTDRQTVKNNGGISSNWSVDYMSNLQLMSCYLSADGTVLYFSLVTAGKYIIIDTNGTKGPNKWGYDVFWLTLVKNPNNGSLRLTDEYATLVEKGGKLPRDILQNKKGASTSASLGNNLFGRY